MNFDLGLLIQFVLGGSFGAIAIALINYLLTRPKVRAEANQIRAEAAKISTDTTRVIIQQMDEHQTRLENRIETLEGDAAEWRKEREDLHAYIFLLRKHIQDQLGPPPPAWPDRVFK